jgi:hypothetical protein
MPDSRSYAVTAAGAWAGAGSAVASDFDVEFAVAGEGRRRETLAVCWNVAFEQVAPVREFSSRRGRRGFPGWWWFAKTGEHVGYESWLERDHVMRLDFDRRVTAVSSQPFWLSWSELGRRRRHAPDFFARLADGAGLVIDVRADEQVKPADAQAFAATAAACECVGWRYERVGVLDPVLVANTRWLSGYRHQRCRRPLLAKRLCEVFSVPTELMAGARKVGDPIAVLPVAFHLMWSGTLVADLAATPLTMSSVVAARVT